MKRSHLIWTLAGGAAVVAIGVTAAVAAPALAADPASASSTSLVADASPSCPAAGLRQEWKTVPQEFKKALRAALTSDDRVAALTRLRDDALAGTYGDAVKDAVANSPLATWQGGIPDQLKKDLADLRSLDTRREKVAAGRKIWASALAGDYGSQVQSLAQSVQQCRAAADKG